jgi:hypothetical protein
LVEAQECYGWMLCYGAPTVVKRLVEVTCSFQQMWGRWQRMSRRKPNGDLPQMEVSGAHTLRDILIKNAVLLP